MKNKTKTHRFFPRFEQVTGNCYEFWLFHCAVCSCCKGQMNGFGFGFFDSHLKTSVFVINIVFFCLLDSKVKVIFKFARSGHSTKEDKEKWAWWVENLDFYTKSLFAWLMETTKDCAAGGLHKSCVGDANFPFVNGRCHLKGSLSFLRTVVALWNGRCNL